MQEVGSDKWTIQWQSTAENRLGQEYVSYWQWIRVQEYYKERFWDERYEHQERVALRIMEKSRINPKLIKYMS